MSCHPNTKAGKMYLKRMIQAMVVYIVLVFFTTYLVRHAHVTGWMLYLVALVPVLPVLRMIHGLLLYIAEENDEFQRLLVVRSVLCGTTAILALAAFEDFLRSYTPASVLPPFSLFIVFWMVFGLAQGVQQASNKAGSDDEPA